MNLAIDTSTEQASVAVYDGRTVRGEVSWYAERNHSRHLTRAIESLLALTTTDTGDLRAVVVATGPGSFSGVRVGVSEAKGLAMALDIPLVGINTLDLIASQCRTAAPRAWCTISAGRNDLAAARYALVESGARRETEYVLLSIDQLRERLEPPVHIAGPGASEVAADLSHRSGISFERGADRIRRAGFLAELGERYLNAGGKDQLFELEPLYLRLSAAEEKQAARDRE